MDDAQVIAIIANEQLMAGKGSGKKDMQKAVEWGAALIALSREHLAKKTTAARPQEIEIPEMRKRPGFNP